MTLETDQWEHESIDWDVNMYSDEKWFKGPIHFWLLPQAGEGGAKERRQEASG